jgi:hypothetical protein
MTEETTSSLKTIENKQTAIPFSKDTKAKYSDLIKTVIGVAIPERGITMHEMRLNIRILDKIELVKSEDESFQLSEEEVALIKRAVESSTWTIQHRDLVDFADYIASI